MTDLADGTGVAVGAAVGVAVGATIDDGLPMQRYRLHAEICKVLTDPKRLMLIDALRAGERSVGELAGAVGSNLANVSQHLAILRHAGLVDTRRTGTSIHYRLTEPDLLTACDVIERIVRRRLPRPDGDR